MDDDESLGLLVVGPDRPYSVDEIEDGCQAEVVGTLPYAPDAARVWTDGAHPGRSFRRSALHRAAGDLAGELTARLAPPAPSADAAHRAAGRSRAGGYR